MTKHAHMLVAALQFPLLEALHAADASKAFSKDQLDVLKNAKHEDILFK